MYIYNHIHQMLDMYNPPQKKKGEDAKETHNSDYQEGAINTSWTPNYLMQMHHVFLYYNMPTHHKVKREQNSN